ncbi:hypothetical protein Aconfl_25730 [Algoriphagus confluentis]|uniref:Uncharacterized protein n=1 Tax=Algoriphagus confluentis TaxID=1697556 RepID=A0ABQ6PPQ7_9BACT|nr:hypothetical protein Aconfl_25730 [Algoriphagus confluentis]
MVHFVKESFQVDIHNVLIAIIPACILRFKQEEFQFFYAAYFKVST